MSSGIGTRIIDDFYTMRSFETEYDTKPLMERVWHVFCAIINTIIYYLSMIPRLFNFTAEECVAPNVEKHEWKIENNKGLYVVIHGLNASPKTTAWNYVSQIKKEHPNTYEIRAPHVHEKGNCSLKDAAKPILKMVNSYIAKNPGKPIHLIGTSNGARIAAFVEVALRKKNVNIRITAVAGVFFGSKTMEILTKWPLVRAQFHNSIIQDFKIASKRSKNLIEKMREPVTIGSRSYEFYATPNDESMPNRSSSLPREIPGATYHPFVSGQSHISIWDSLRPKVLKDSYEWMKAQPLS
jgi:hypothetical protein